MTVQPERQPHAALDEQSRVKKAIKIERLLSLVCSVSGAKILEVGTGAGFIAAHFAVQVGPAGEVLAVDVTDNRKVHHGYRFRRVADTTLPFDDAAFDICISNHVLEHVGDRSAQAAHLGEIRRVLRPNGWLYLAVPNRWTLLEPHFHLPLLSWLPPGLRDGYVRLARRGPHYDCDPLSLGEIVRLLRGSHFSPRDVSYEGIKAVAEMEVAPGLRRVLLQHPEMWARPIRAIFPTYLFLAQPT